MKCYKTKYAHCTIHYYKRQFLVLTEANINLVNINDWYRIDSGYNHDWQRKISLVWKFVSSIDDMWNESGIVVF